jgi:hypothetical protein
MRAGLGSLIMVVDQAGRHSSVTKRARIAFTFDTVALTIFGVGVIYSIVGLVMGPGMHPRWGWNCVIPLVCSANMSNVMFQPIGRRLKKPLDRISRS